MHELVWSSETEDETQHCGYLFAQNCQGNVLVLLDGPLGAGKTVFIRGLARGFGVGREICSPSFNIMNVYAGSCYTLFHIDAFREKSTTWDVLNIDDIAAEPFCCAVEWSEHFFEYPEDLDRFHISIEPNDQRRIITIRAQNSDFLLRLLGH